MHGQVAPLDAPLPALPRTGGLGLVVPARDALPDVAPLALARGLGLSWIVSVGDGDPAEVLAFLTADAMTSSLGIVLGPGASGASLRSVLGAKPAVLWGGDALARAVARRAGAVVVDGGLSSFLAHVQLFDAGVEPGAAVEVIVVGGGRAYVDDEVRAAALDARVVAVDERAPDELDAAIAAAAAAHKPVVLVAGTAPAELSRAVGRRRGAPAVGRFAPSRASARAARRARLARRRERNDAHAAARRQGAGRARAQRDRRRARRITTPSAC